MTETTETSTTGRFVAVPVTLIADAGLSPRARAIAVFLRTLTDREGAYAGSLKPLTDAGLGSERVIRKAMAELEASGDLTRTRTKNGMLYRLPAE